MKYLLQADWERLVKNAERYEAIVAATTTGTYDLCAVLMHATDRAQIDGAVDAELERQVDASRRAGGGMDCKACGREYRKHPKGGPIGCGDEQFLNRLCDGSLVKL